MSLIYDVTAAAIAATMVGNELAVAAFVHPQLSRLDDSAHARTAALLATVLGKVMPPWYGLSLLLISGTAIEHRPVLHGPGLLLLVAALLWAATIIFSIALLVPINDRIAKLDSAHPYQGWQKDRARWDHLHQIRVVLLLVALVFLLTGLLAAARAH